MYLPVKTACTHKGLVKYVSSVCSCKDNYICVFNQFDFERPWIPSERVPRVTPKDKSWGAIYDLLAEASLYSFKISGVVPYDELIDKYGEENYQTVNMEEITDIVTKAVRKE